MCLPLAWWRASSSQVWLKDRAARVARIGRRTVVQGLGVPIVINPSTRGQSGTRFKQS